MTEKKLSKRDAAKLEPVMLVATSNPKKPGSMSHERFENYFSFDWEAAAAGEAEYTVKDMLEAGLRMDDIRHDSEHGFIVVGDQAIEDHIEGLKLERERRIEEARKLLEEVDGE